MGKKTYTYKKACELPYSVYHIHPVVFHNKTNEQTCNENNQNSRHNNIEISSTWYDMWSSPTCFWPNNTDHLQMT